MTRNDINVARYHMKRGSRFARLIRGLTKWAWKYQVEAAVHNLHERGFINSYAFHEGVAFAKELMSDDLRYIPDPQESEIEKQQLREHITKVTK